MVSNHTKIIDYLILPRIYEHESPLDHHGAVCNEHETPCDLRGDVCNEQETPCDLRGDVTN